ERRPAMTPEEAFLRDIQEHPDEDAPRLIFADWLEDQGDPRGEFIRVQCALAALEEGNPRRASYLRREKALLRQHRKAWLEPLRGLVKWPVVFRRGFIEDVQCPAAQFLNQAERLFGLTPVRHVWLKKTGNRVTALAELPYLHYLTSLHLHENDLGDGGLAVLAASPFVGLLTCLDLSRNGAGDEGALALAASPHLARLTTLLLNSNRALADRGVEALASSPFLSGLRCLDLGYCAVRDAGAQALARSPHLTQLRRLDLGLNFVGADGVRALAASANLANLAALDLGMNAVST